jgi:retron-type reverse transcriptase
VRGQQDALDALIVGISSRKKNFILDADIRSLFTEVSQQWLVSFLEHRIGDKRMLRPVQKWLREFSRSLHPDKTRLIEFGRFALQNRERRGLGIGRASSSWALVGMSGA